MRCSPARCEPQSAAASHTVGARNVREVAQALQPSASRAAALMWYVMPGTGLPASVNLNCRWGLKPEGGGPLSCNVRRIQLACGWAERRGCPHRWHAVLRGMLLREVGPGLARAYPAANWSAQALGHQRASCGRHGTHAIAVGAWRAQWRGADASQFRRASASAALLLQVAGPVASSRAGGHVAHQGRVLWRCRPAGCWGSQRRRAPRAERRHWPDPVARPALPGGRCGRTGRGLSCCLACRRGSARCPRSALGRRGRPAAWARQPTGGRHGAAKCKQHPAAWRRTGMRPSPNPVCGGWALTPDPARSRWPPAACSRNQRVPATADGAATSITGRCTRSVRATLTLPAAAAIGLEAVAAAA